ncbi:hypothetical protein PHYSODRAFT_293597 [Phytophthora sojae]|uniref:DUF659 domain-containing protein n=1 Tax=Phytophthora sojae (strain P6497) TaxID=1094619 RepID=G4YPE2_PHYSP|nr:hypothetical protein PHYSODRAFT_293597 [Phytophthora sojae]EGZ27922.1 hypothetical protein PHYSODRAFT_293597 [Phytophthora sojae]|eukprot:XP_009515197.1 hypothetical protein PHYSODRAFT_293597 [Phytophthora sojae]
MYGLKVGSRNAEQVRSRRQEAQSDANRARTTNPKFFTSFRTNLFEKHLVGQHPVKWAEYCKLSTDDERRAYFTSVPVPYSETLDSVLESEDVLVFAVNRAIVDKIVGGLLFHPDDVDEKSHAKALSSFVPQGPQYKITIKRPSRFRLCLRLLGRGASFRMTANLMDDTREETGIGRYGGCSEGVVAHYARVQLGRSRWPLTAGLAWASPYVDVRCRYYTNGSLENYHLLAIPLYERHTALNIFAVVVELLDALVPRWRYQLLGVATDGAATMVGCVNGVATRLEKEAKHMIVRVWCGLHKLDLKMQLVFEQALNETYLTKVTDLIGFLRRQQNLVADMQTTCPKVASTRWLSMYAVADFLSEKEAECSPNLVWWIFLFALRELACEVNAVFVSLQGMTTLVKQQDDRFGGLVQRLLNISGALGPLDEAAILELDSGKYEIIGSFVISHAAAATYVNNLDLCVSEGLKTLAEGQQTLVVNAVARVYLLAISNIFALKEPAHISPRVTPKELVTSSMVDLASLIDPPRANPPDIRG